MMYVIGLIALIVAGYKKSSIGLSLLSIIYMGLHSAMKIEREQLENHIDSINTDVNNIIEEYRKESISKAVDITKQTYEQEIVDLFTQNHKLKEKIDKQAAGYKEIIEKLKCKHKEDIKLISDKYNYEIDDLNIELDYLDEEIEDLEIELEHINKIKTELERDNIKYKKKIAAGGSI